MNSQALSSTARTNVREERVTPGAFPRLPEELCQYGTWTERQAIIAGPESTRGLRDEVTRLGGTRVFLFTTASLVAERTLLDRVRLSLGELLVGEFSGCRAHTPRSVILEAATAVRAAQPDLLVSFGGSTVTDTAKAVSLALSNGIATANDFDSVDPAQSVADGSLIAPLIPKVAIPTTLSGAEYSAYAGITNEATHVKRVYYQPGLAPASVFLDTTMTAATPPVLWNSTGVKCLSDSIELMCSRSSHPFVQVIARSAVELFARHLPDSMSEDPAVRDTARAYCLHATWMSAYSLSNSTSRLGIGTSVRHQLGPMGVPHGEATCIMLPHLLAFNWPALDDVRGDIAAALGLGRDDSVPAADVADRLRTFVASLGLPYRLADVGIDEADIPGLAERMMDDPFTATNPRTVTVADLEALLRDAY